MKRLTAITVLCVLFLSAFAAGKGPAGAPGYPDSLRSVWLYTEGIKQNAIARDTVRAREFFVEAIRNDSTFAPAYYEMAANGMYSTPDEAVDLARTAFRLDTANKWYHQFLGQALIYARRYDEALAVYRRLRSDEPQNPDNYRILAALYEQAQQPFSAIATLDFESRKTSGELMLLFFLIIVFLADLFSVLASSALGGKALKMNPNKTVKGLTVGSCLAVIAGIGLYWLTPFSILQTALYALAIVLSCIMGDMVISSVKRSLGSKSWESEFYIGRGIIERLAPLTFAAPVFYHLTLIFQNFAHFPSIN